MIRKTTYIVYYIYIHILSNSAKFSAGRHLLPAYNFSATMASTYRA